MTSNRPPLPSAGVTPAARRERNQNWDQLVLILRVTARKAKFEARGKKSAATGLKLCRQIFVAAFDGTVLDYNCYMT